MGWTGGAVEAGEQASILIVDDTPANLVALRAVLESLGQPIIQASSGHEALKHLLREDFACILLDVQMPGLDGFETARLIKAAERTRYIPLLFLTAISREEAHIVRGYTEGAVDYIVKPFEPDFLRAKVKVFVDLYRREEQVRSRERAMMDRERAGFQSELRLRSRVLDSMTEGVSVADEQGIIVYTNPAEDRIFGYARGELLGQHVTVQNAYPPEENQRIVAEVIAALRAKGEWNGEWLNKKKDGTTFITRSRITALELDGKPHWVCVQEDVTEQAQVRRRAEVLTRELRESEEQFRTLADSIPQLTWIAEADGSIHWYNRRWYEYTGTTLEEMKAEYGWGWRRVHHPAELPRVETKFREAVASGQPWEDIFPLRRHDGEFRAHLSRAMPVRDAQGRIVRWFGTNTDVEDQRRQAAELREAVQARDTFLSVASHELKTPLTPLALRLAQLKRHAQGTAQGHQIRAHELRHVEIAESQVRKLAVLVDGLLDVSRLAHGRLSLQLEEVDVGELVRKAVEAMRPAAERSGSVLDVHADVPARGRFDGMRVNQVVTNLLSNAIKFGAGKPIHVNLTVLDDHVRLSVRDEGIGIPAEALGRIFNKFERAVSERNYGGLGLGLWLTRQIVEAMGGTVKAESAPGDGATFTVELPLGTQERA